MHTKNFLVDQGRDWETVEAVSEHFPEFNSVAALAFVVETINTVDRGALVVPA